MDFFTHQDVARRKTGILVVFFVLAVILIILAVYLAVSAVFFSIGAEVNKATQAPRTNQRAPTVQDWLASTWDPTRFLGVSAGTLVVILGGSVYKTAALRAGGESVATMLGGRRLHPHSGDSKERMLLNVVEEMAIASGTPVPQVFLLDQEAGINAFAAGFTPNDAVIGVTRGTLELLTRDELQGVIAHEFSHILNGDMRLNMRLMGILHGILLIGIIGYVLMRSSRPARSRSRGNQQNVVVVLGLALFVIGYVGVFFAKLIKSAVSRQREFLADAAAVQFTRNPSGIAEALKKIGGVAQGSRLESPQAEQASHMFFGNALTTSLFGLMSTHPPLIARIRRIEPSFDGTFPKVHRITLEAEQVGGRAMLGNQRLEASAIQDRVSAMALTDSGAQTIPFKASNVVAEVGLPAPRHLAYASALISVIPERIQAMVREPFGARAVVYGLLLDKDPDVRKTQFEQLARHADAAVYRETRQFESLLPQVSPEMRLPLIDLAIPALKELSPGQYRNFRDNVNFLVKADSRIELFEYVLHRMLLNHLAPQYQSARPRIVQYYAIRPLLEHCGYLLSALAYVGNKGHAARERAFTLGAQRLRTSESGAIQDVSLKRAGLDEVNSSLKVLAVASPGIKKRVLDACAQCVGADGRISIQEGELLRVIADSLDCPMPPILAGTPAD